MENQPRKSESLPGRPRRGETSSSSRTRFGEEGSDDRSERRSRPDDARRSRASDRSARQEGRHAARSRHGRPEGRPPRHNPARSSDQPTSERTRESRSRSRRLAEERPADGAADALLAHAREALSKLPAPDEAISRLLASPRARLIAIIVVIALMGWGVALALGSCSAAPHPTAPTSADFVSHSAPNWADLHEEDGRMVYTVDGEVVSKTGVDVSEHQGEIDWHAVAGDGIDFAFIRVGRRGAAEGEVREDACYAQNMAGAREAGLDVGVYFFSQAITEEEAVEEADFVLSRLKGRDLDYPVVYDHEPVEGVEGRSDNLSVEQMTANAKAFCDRIAAAGYPAMIYGNATDLARYSLKDLSDYGIWFAEYGSTIPSRLGRFSIWQYTNEGEVDGIGRTVDLNIRFPENNA